MCTAENNTNVGKKVTKLSNAMNKSTDFMYLQHKPFG